MGEASTSSAVTDLRYLAFGFGRPCNAFLTLTSAKSCSVAPYRSMRRLAYSAKYVGFVAPSR